MPKANSASSATLSALSRRGFLGVTAAFSAAALTGKWPSAMGQALAPSAQGEFSRPKFTNPLFGGDYPDPTILRVGSDFYMTHTCYSFTPALVVWHSRDLVNWTPISHALDETHGEVWSPDLVERDGRFYIYFPMGGHLFVVYADDPRGPWSQPIDLKINDIDPGHVFGPDGKRYVYTAGGHVTELTADGLARAGETRKIYDGWQYPKDWKTEGFWLESPKSTKRGEFYYLICAEGGTSGPPTSHMSVVARSTSPLGPWENSPHNPLVHTYSADEQWWSVGHGTLVSTPDDRWYFVSHGYRRNFQSLGRHNILEPIEWTDDGWPVAPLGARRSEPMPAPMGVAQAPEMELSDDFKDPVLRLTWGAWNEPDMSRFKPGEGILRVGCKGSSFEGSSPLTIKARDVSYSVQVAAQIDDGACGALGLRYNPNVALFVQWKGGRVEVYGLNKNLASRDWSPRTSWFKMVNRQNRIELLVSNDGQDWQSLITDFDATDFNTNHHGGFQAARPALSSSGSGSTRFADFRYAKI
jgi:xylan 1,4-beta-xylosidase